MVWLWLWMVLVVKMMDDAANGSGSAECGVRKGEEELLLLLLPPPPPKTKKIKKRKRSEKMKFAERLHEQRYAEWRIQYM